MTKKYPMKYISYSQISSYLSCPENFYNTYILGHRDDGNKWTEMGNYIHNLAETFPNPTKKDLKKIQAFFKSMTSKMDRTKFEDDVDFQEAVDKCRIMTNNYIRRFKDVPAPVAVEKKFFVKFSEDLPATLSYIDRIDGDPEDASTWIITDYKSSNNPWPKSRLKTEFQLMWYAAQIFHTYGKWPKRVQYYFPVTDKLVSADLLINGVYAFNNQRDPVLEYYEIDMMTMIEETVEKIINEEFTSDSTDSFFCRNFCSVHKSLEEGERRSADGWEAL